MDFKSNNARASQSAQASSDQASAETMSAAHAQAIVDQIHLASQNLIAFMKGHTANVNVNNPSPVNIHQSSPAPAIVNMPDLSKAVEELKNIKASDVDSDAKMIAVLTGVSDKLQALVDKADPAEAPDHDYTGAFADLHKAVTSLGKQLNVTVKPADVKIVNDSKDMLAKLDSIATSMDKLLALEAKEPEFDDAKLLKALKSLQEAVKANKPISNGSSASTASFKNADGSAARGSAVTSTSDATKTGIVVLNPDGSNISGGSGGSGTQYTQGGATVANPTGTAEIWFDGSNNPKAVTPSQPLPSNLTDGTTIASVVPGDTGFNGVATSGAAKTISFTTSSTGVQTLLANTDVRGYSWVEIVYTSVGVGLALTAQYSTASGGAYVNPGSVWTSSNGTLAALGTTVSTIYSAPIRGNFLQLAVSALTSGTFSGTVTLRTVPTTTGIVASISGSVSSNSATGSAVPANAFYMAGQSGGNLTGVNITSPSDGATFNNGFITSSAGHLYNGTNEERARANTTAAVIAAGATTTQTSATQTTYNAAKLGIVINISAFTSGTLTFTVNGLTSSSYTYTMGASTALNATGTTVLWFFPGATVTANSSFNQPLPRQYTVTVSGTFVATYGVDSLLSV